MSTMSAGAFLSRYAFWTFSSTPELAQPGLTSETKADAFNHVACNACGTFMLIREGASQKCGCGSTVGGS
jgi:hypothetical protein